MSGVFTAIGSTLGVTAPPTNTVRPDVTGTAEVGETLTCSTGTWTGSPTITYQWRRDNVNIGGETASAYDVDVADEGSKLSCYVTGTNAGGSLTVRATTDYPTILIIDGDSITAASSWPEMLQTALGAGWDVQNYAVSAQTLDDMAADAATQIDPQADPGSSLVMPWEYINQSGISTGAEISDKIEAYIAAREAAGHIGLYATDFHIDTDCQTAGDLIRTNHPNAIELDRSDLRADAATFGDDIHLTSAGHAIVADVVEDYLSTNGYAGYLGGIPIEAAADLTKLKTYIAPSYVYNPVSPLPYPLPFSPCYLHVTSGSGWDIGSFLMDQTPLEDWDTGADGEQRLYSITPAQSTGSLSNGTYFLSGSA